MNIVDAIWFIAVGVIVLAFMVAAELGSLRDRVERLEKGGKR